MKKKYGSVSVPEVSPRSAFNLTKATKTFYLKSKPSYPLLDTKPHEAKESKKDLFIANRNGAKESKGILVTKSKEKTQRKISSHESFGVVHLLERNYREKLFHLKKDQKNIFMQFCEKGLVPMRPRNISPEVFGPVIPFLSFDTRKTVMSQRNVDNALDKIKNYVPPELVRSSTKSTDESRKLLLPMKKKQSIDHFKSQLATTGSLARLASHPNQNQMGDEQVRAESLSKPKGTRSSDAYIFRKPTLHVAGGVNHSNIMQKKIYFINHKHDRAIRLQREAQRASHLKALKNDESNDRLETEEGNHPFFT